MGDRLYYTQKTYNVPARYGQRVILRGSEKEGVIVSSRGPLLAVLFDGESDLIKVHFSDVVFAVEEA